MRVALLDPSLVRTIVRLADRARVLAEASAAVLERAGGRPHPESRAPTRRGPALLDEISERFAGARSDRDLRRLIEWAEAEIRLVTHGPDREPETAEQFRFRLCAEYEGKPAQFVADRERVSAAYVYRVRKEDGRDARGFQRQSA